MEELAEHGVFLPPNMQGLTDDQIEELKLRDEWGEKCVPSGGAEFKKDDIGRRNGHAPNEKMKQVLKKTIEEAKAIISKKHVEAGVCVTMEMVKDALDQLRGATMIVYPMGLPPYDPIRMEFENKEDLSGTQVRGSHPPKRRSPSHRTPFLFWVQCEFLLQKLLPSPCAEPQSGDLNWGGRAGGPPREQGVHTGQTEGLGAARQQEQKHCHLGAAGKPGTRVLCLFLPRGTDRSPCVEPCVLASLPAPCCRLPPGPFFVSLLPCPRHLCCVSPPSPRVCTRPRGSQRLPSSALTCTSLGPSAVGGGQRDRMPHLPGPAVPNREGAEAALDVIVESEAQLWWAAKELRRTKRLSDYVGRNEKTKIIVKIQQRGQGAPAREPVISSEEQKQLMLYYHRRQEELKRLEEEEDDACLNSPWADSSALKRHFHGVKDIKWRPR